MKRLITLMILALTLTASTAHATAYPFTSPKPQFFDSNGNPCSGCRIRYFSSGTSTPKDVYSDSSMATNLGSVITLNARGEFPSLGVWLDGTYSVKLETSTGTLIWGPVPDITGVLPLSAFPTTNRWQASGVIPSYVAATQFSVPGDYRSTFPVGRRVQIIGSTTIYGRVTASAYVIVTTVTVALDSGVIDANIATVNVSLETPTNTSISADMIATGTTAANITSSGSNTWSGANVFTGTETHSGAESHSGVITASGGINSTGTTTLTTVVKTGTTVITNLNADLLDGYSEATANTISTIVRRDGSGNFAAGTITANLTGTASTATNASGTGTAVYAAQTGLKIVAGSIDNSGVIQRGTGFTVVSYTGGLLIIDFSVAFSAIPVVSATAWYHALGASASFLPTYPSTASRIVIRTGDTTHGDESIGCDFIAIGP